MVRRICPVLALLAAGCGSAASGGDPKPLGIEPTAAWATVACGAGTRAVGTACVAEFLDDVVFPAAADLGPIERDASGRPYLQGLLFVQLRDPATPAAQADTLAAAHGGRVIGAVPGAGLYHLAFAGAQGDAALAAKEAALAADPLVASTFRDEVLLDAADADPRGRDTDLERLGTDAVWTEAPGQPGIPIGSLGKWPFARIRLSQAWDALHDGNPPLSPVRVGILDGRVAQAAFYDVPFAGSADLRWSDYEPPGSSSVGHGTAVASIIGATDDHFATTGVVAGLPCVKYDLTAIAVLGEERTCSTQLECGGADWACVRLDDDADRVCYLGCGDAMPPCPAGRTCQETDVGGTRLKLCRTSVKRSTLAFNAIYYGMIRAVKAGARVVNLSLGSQLASSPASRTRIVTRVRQVAAWAPDTLFVMAAGNTDADAAFHVPCSAARTDEASPGAGLPASAPNLLCVGATGANDEQAVWTQPPAWNNPAGLPTTRIGASNRDADPATRAIELSAPGDRILAQWPDGTLRMFGGTSGAAPLVSGTAALLFAVLPGMDGEIAKRILLTQADPIADAGLGGRRLNAEDAVRKAIAIADALHPASRGQGECRPKDPPPSTGGSANICKTDGLACEWHLKPETGSPVWIGVLDAGWTSETRVNRLDLDVQAPSLGRTVSWGVTFSGGEPRETQIVATHERVQATGGSGRMRFDSREDEVDIATATIDARFSGRGLSGTFEATAADGRKLQLDLAGTTDDFPWL